MVVSCRATNTGRWYTPIFKPDAHYYGQDGFRLKTYSLLFINYYTKIRPTLRVKKKRSA